MNHDRIRTLIDHLRNPRPNQPVFSIGDWFADAKGQHIPYVEDLPEQNFCDTKACIAGTTVWLFRDQVEDKFTPISDAARDLLGLTEDQAADLFYARHRRGELLFDQVDRNDAADILEDLLA